MKPPSAMQIELQAIITADQLNTGRAAILNRKTFFNFFLIALQDTDPERWISYCRQFVHWLPSICAGLDACCWDPFELRQLLDIIRLFQKCCPDQNVVTAEAEHKIRLACALDFLYVGESGLAAETLGWPQPPKGSFANVYEQLMSIAPPGRMRDELAVTIKTVRAKAGIFRSDALNVLLVAGENEFASGVVLPLHIQVKKRPNDTEDDRVLLNNSVPLQHGGLLWSLQDAVLAGRSCLPKDAQDLRYSMQFSLPEKEAELVGSSLGFAAAVLTVSSMINSYYNFPLCTLNQNVAFTGGITPDGRLSAVNEQGLRTKINAVFFSPLERLFVAQQNLRSALQYVYDLNHRYPHRRLAVHGFELLSQVMIDRNLVRQKSLTLAAKLIARTQRIYGKRRKIALSTLLLVLLCLLFWKTGIFFHDDQPMDFDIKGSTLIVKNKTDDVLWNYDFGAPLIKSAYLDEKNQMLHPRLLFNDINHDGKIETIIGIDEARDQSYLSGTIYCFSNDGRIIWTARPGRTIHFNQEEFDNHYGIFEMQNVRNRKGQRFIAVAANHVPFFPSFIALYNGSGELVGQFWNAGNVTDMAVFNIDHDGDEEIMASGYRNEDGQAFVAILEIDNMWGLSPQDKSGNYYSRDLPPGTERWYLRLPPSPFSRKDSYRDTVFPLICDNRGISFNLSNCGILEEGDDDWSCTVACYQLDSRMHIASWYMPDLAVATIQRKLERPLSSAEINALSRIEYWDGEKWVDTLSENKRYTDILR